MQTPTIKIIEYNKDQWGDAVCKLFTAIYPDWPAAQRNRMAYDNAHPLHTLTLLAVSDMLPIGQINIFRVGKSTELGNVGYHVHPDWHRKGVASLLLCEVWPKVANMFTDGLVIQTDERNNASRKLAIKAGFAPASKGLIASYNRYLKFLYQSDGLCFHLPRTVEKPPESLQRSALRAAFEFQYASRED